MLIEFKVLYTHHDDPEQEKFHTSFCIEREDTEDFLKMADEVMESYAEEHAEEIGIIDYTVIDITESGVKCEVCGAMYKIRSPWEYNGTFCSAECYLEYIND